MMITASCAVQSVHFPYTARPPGRFKFGAGVGAGLGRDYSIGYAGDSQSNHSEEDFYAPYYQAYFNFSPADRLNVSLSVNFSIGFSSVETDLGVNYTLVKSSPFYFSVGLQGLYLMGDGSYTVTVGSSTVNVTKKFQVYGARVPVLFTFTPFSWIDITAGIPLYFNYLYAQNKQEGIKEKEFLMVPSLYFSVTLNVWKLQLMPSLSVLFSKNPDNGKYFAFPCPGLFVGFLVP